MKVKWDAPWLYSTFALMGALYDVVSFLGLPPFSGSKLLEIVASFWFPHCHL